MQSDAKGVGLLDPVDETTAKELDEEEDEDGDADSVVRVCQAALGPDSEVAEDEDDYEEQAGYDLQAGVVSNCEAWATGMEPHDHDGRRNEQEEDESGEDAVGEDHVVVLRQRRESVAHACETVLVSRALA